MSLYRRRLEGFSVNVGVRFYPVEREARDPLAAEHGINLSALVSDALEHVARR